MAIEYHTCVPSPDCPAHEWLGFIGGEPCVACSLGKTQGPLVYFISDGQAIKIGMTTGDARSRMSELQTGNPRELTLHHTMKTRSRADAYIMEGHLHDALAEHRLYGEWFEASAVHEFMPRYIAEVRDWWSQRDAALEATERVI